MTVIATMLAAVLAVAQAADQSSGRLMGQVVEQGSRTPIANARVMVFSMARPQAGPPQILEATTDAEGRFTLDSLLPGAYRVQASKAGYAMQTFDAQQLIVEVLPGQTRQGVAVSLSRGDFRARVGFRGRARSRSAGDGDASHAGWSGRRRDVRAGGTGSADERSR